MEFIFNTSHNVIDYLIQGLSPYNDDLFPKYSSGSNAIFRGQSNADYQLTPSAFRGTDYKENKDFNLSFNQCDTAINAKELLELVHSCLENKELPHYIERYINHHICWNYLKGLKAEAETLNAIREYLFERTGKSKSQTINRTIDYLKYFHEDQMYREISHLTDFTKGQDLRGGSIPEDSYKKRQMLIHLSEIISSTREKYPLNPLAVTEHNRSKIEQKEIQRRKHVKSCLNDLGFKHWPDNSLLSLLSLAQHSGVPTRLLDWTFNFNIALYFACKDIPEMIYKNSLFRTEALDKLKFAVWILQGLPINKMDDEKNKIKIVVPPYGGNKFLNAQKGVFTYWERTNLEELSKDENYEFNHKPLEKCFKYIKSHNARLCKLVIPYQHAPMILKYLDSIHINAATVFPNDEGAAKYQKECNYWPLTQHLSAYEYEEYFLYQNRQYEMKKKENLKSPTSSSDN